MNRFTTVSRTYCYGLPELFIAEVGYVCRELIFSQLIVLHQYLQNVPSFPKNYNTFFNMFFSFLDCSFEDKLDQNYDFQSAKIIYQYLVHFVAVRYKHRTLCPRKNQFFNSEKSGKFYGWGAAFDIQLINFQRWHDERYRLAQ